LPSPRTRMAGEDLLTEGTQVPEPRMVTLRLIALLYITDVHAGHILSKRADTGVCPYRTFLINPAIFLFDKNLPMP